MRRRRAAAGRGGARARRASSRCGSRRRRASRSSTARSSWPRSARSASSAPQRLARAADIACALSLEALQGSRTSFLPQIQALRPLPGQADVGGERAPAARGLGDQRGAPLVRPGAGRLLAALRAAGARRLARPARLRATDTVAVELNAATDNPLVLVEDELLVSNGNFHGQPLAFALDALAMAVAELASISERRVERLVNPSLSGGLPAFLTADGGLNSGFMIPQYVAASLVSENKVLCHPASVDSIPTSAGQEDHVSMGNAAGPEGVAGARERRARARDRAARRRQGVEFLAPLEPGAASRGAGSSGRSRRACATTGRSRRHRAVAAAIRDGSLVGRSSRGGGSMSDRRRLRRRRAVPGRSSSTRRGARDRRVATAAWRGRSSRPALRVATAWTGGGARRASARRRERDRRSTRGRGALRRPLRDPRAARDASSTRARGRPRRRCGCCSTTSTPRSPSGPEELVVYGGSARRRATTRRCGDRPLAARPRRRRDAARPERQAGRRLPDAPRARRAC